MWRPMFEALFGGYCMAMQLLTTVRESDVCDTVNRSEANRRDGLQQRNSSHNAELGISMPNSQHLVRTLLRLPRGRYSSKMM